jgi:hypothetical protein
MVYIVAKTQEEVKETVARNQGCMCKKALNWISKTIRRMTRKRALERSESKIANSEVTSQAIWPIAKFLTNRDGPRAPITIHGPLGIKFNPLEKANTIADVLEKQCVKKTINGKWMLESKISLKL